MTTPGIGASSIMGVAFEVLPAPVQAALATAASGGTIVAGTYRYVVTAINGAGETIASNEQTIVTSGATSTVTVTWATVTGATGFKLYKTAAGGAVGTELLYKTVGVVVSDIDTTPGTPTGAFPTINTAGNPGVYVPPTKFIPYLSESLKFAQQTNWRRPVRNTPGLVGASAGFSNAEGDVVIEALTDCIVYFLAISRCTFVKTLAGPFQYVFTPAPVAIPTRTLSITIVRNGVVYGYVGCTTGSFKFEVNNAVLQLTASLISTNETVQASPSGVTWPTTVPFGAGQYNLQIPTATQIFDSDGFTFESNDNATPQFRLISANTGAQFVAFGESAASISITRDFFNRTEYDAFKALTAKSITLTATHAAPVESIALVAPVSIVDTYEVNIGSQGDLVRASVAYQAAIDGTGKHYQITVITAESIT